MARLAYCRSEPNFQFDQEAIRAVLEPLKFTSRFFESMSAPDGMGTHCLIAFHDDTDPTKVLTVVVFRGTDAADPTDLADDGKLLQREWPQGGLVHRGFAEALDPILPDLDSALDESHGRILFTGHSLGAAMATLLASVKRPDFLYTFGSPRVGDTQFTSTLTGVSTCRFVDCCDVVTRIPPEALGEVTYVHYAPPSYIDRNGQIREQLTDDEIDEDRFLGASEYLVEYAWWIGNVGVRELADHAPINYVTATAANALKPDLASPGACREGSV
jgi:hypothetical protein